MQCNGIFHYTMEYYPAMKRKEVLCYTTTQVNLEDRMLRPASRRRTNTARSISVGVLKQPNSEARLGWW